ncbi:MAG: hypothetical protein KGN02_01400 [bacterium]|nr:hypothetical protein [bacterium]
MPKGKRGAKTQRHGGRVVLSIDVEPRVRDALRERAAAAGVSMAEYLSNALAEPERLYATTAAEVTQPLAIVSYHLRQVLAALESDDPDRARSELQAAVRVIAAALKPLERAHADEIRSVDRRRAGGWTG